HHPFITDRDGDTVDLEADHRRHAEVENAIRDLKYGVGLNHLPSGRFGANAAWLALNVMAHNMAGITTRIGRLHMPPPPPPPAPPGGSPAPPANTPCTSPETGRGPTSST